MTELISCMSNLQTSVMHVDTNLTLNSVFVLSEEGTRTIILLLHNLRNDP